MSEPPQEQPEGSEYTEAPPAVPRSRPWMSARQRGTAAVAGVVFVAGARAVARALGYRPQAPARGTAPWFEEAATSRGLAFTYHSGHSCKFLLSEIVGGGVAAFDMDG